MKLVVGLGNPGNEYNNTRHNIGFMFLDFILDDNFLLNKKMNALEYDTIINGERVVFIKPLSYMNLSGEVVSKYLSFYKLSSNDLFVIQDDLDLPLSLYKVMFNHGDGGHNGIKDIIKNINTKEFMRLKIGISKNKDMDTKDYVLGRFSKEDLDNLNKCFFKLKDVIYDFISLDYSNFMQKYNTKNEEK